jgi:hypothetical protein
MIEKGRKMVDPPSRVAIHLTVEGSVPGRRENTIFQTMWSHHPLLSKTEYRMGNIQTNNPDMLLSQLNHENLNNIQTFG